MQILLALVAISFAATADSAARHIPPFFNKRTFSLEEPNARADSGERTLNFRLPNETYPEHYDIKLTTNVHKGEKPFQGEVIIDVVVVKATKTITLHARQLEIAKVTIRSTSTGQTEELSNQYETEREFLTLTRKNGKEFAAETKWKLTIIYNGKLRDDNGGFYISTYKDDSGNDRYLATTQFESTDARHAFPCYDEPDKRANFTITIIHSPNLTAISNMPANGALSSSGKTVFLTTARIPTYIVAFIVSDFENTEGVLNKLPQHIYSRASVKNAHSWALVSSMLITQRLTEYYGVEFMMPKMDHVAVPHFAAGGMENWGLATYREEYLLYDEHNSTVFTQTNIANILAHEIAHQWFGDFVAIKWWTYLWLKEGFATLFSYKALADAYPEWDIWQEFHANDYQSALTIDGINAPRPMTHYVQKPREISSLYDSVSYAKAGSVLYMWNNALTDKVFQRGLHNYLTVNQYSAAVEENLFTAIQNAAKEENHGIPATISEMMGTWTHQGGYPLLTITRNYEDGTFTVKQEGYHNDQNVKDYKTWYVPINYAVASKPDFRNTEATNYLLNVTQMKINAKLDKEDWLLVNKQSAYYYRIKYDEENYKLIIKSLIEQPFKIHVRNRAQLMHDAYHFSISKRLDHAILLEMMTYLKKEDQYAPWSTARYIISTFNRYLSGDRKYNQFKSFMADQISPIYEKLGVNDDPGEQHFQKYTRNLIIDLACLVGVQSCLQETNYKLKAHIMENTPIEPNLETLMYSNGFKQAGDEEFNFAYDKLMNSTDQSLRSLLIYALGFSEDKNQIRKFIYSSIDQTNNLRTHERTILLGRVYSRSEVGLLACIEFLNDNWDDYGNLKVDFGGSNPLNDDIISMAYYVVNKNQEDQLLSLVAKVRNSKHVQTDLEVSVKAPIARNFEWIRENGVPFMTSIEQYHQNKVGSGGRGLTASVLFAFISTAFAFISTLVHLF